VKKVKIKITKKLKQLMCPTTDEWVKKIWNIYAMEYYSFMKNKIMSCMTI
jgi:hypothetical protein